MTRLVLSGGGRLFSAVAGDTEGANAQYDLLISVSDQQGNPVTGMSDGNFSLFLHFVGEQYIEKNAQISIFEDLSPTLPGFYHLILKQMPQGQPAWPKLIAVTVTQFDTHRKTGGEIGIEVDLVAQGRLVITVGAEPDFVL